MATEIEAWFGSDVAAELDFRGLETRIRQQALQVAARCLERLFNEDHSDHAGATLPCPKCGGVCRYSGRRNKNVTSVVGDLCLRRAYYHCAACGEGFCPRDRVLGLDKMSLSPGVLRMVGLVGAMVSFEEGHELLGALAGIRVTSKQVERGAEALGREIAADERQRVDPPESGKPQAPTLYLGVDGTGVPVRKSEVAGRPGKQPDGTAKTREVKLCTIWTAETRNHDNKPVRDPGSVTYSAAIESAARCPDDPQPPPFDLRVIREATRRGFLAASRQVIIGDGAAWIWKLAGEHFPDAIQILDLYHAKEHLSDAAKAIYGPDNDLATAWTEARYQELDAGNVAAIIMALRQHATHNNEARSCLTYVINNSKRMRYDHFRKQGLCTASGVVEAGCKTVVGTRLKRAGMRWTVSGADAIIALRCAILSKRYSNFWKQRNLPQPAMTA